MISLMLLEDGLKGSDRQHDASEKDEETHIWRTGADGLHYWPKPRLFKQLAVLYCQPTGSEVHLSALTCSYVIDSTCLWI